MSRFWPLICASVLLRTSLLIAADATTQPTVQPPPNPQTAADSRFTTVYGSNKPAEFAPAYDDKGAWEVRVDFLRHQVLVSQGLWPTPPKTPLNAHIHGRIERDGYTVENVFFESLPGHYVSGNLYRPTGRTGKLPGILAPYGHWTERGQPLTAAGRLIWRTDQEVQAELKAGTERNEENARSTMQSGCAMLAKMGCVVFIYDMVGYCDSTKIPHQMGFVDAEAVMRLQSFMGLQTWNSIRSLDFLLSLPEVDPARLAVTGASSGGTQSMALSATEPRLAAMFPVAMVSMNMQGGCVCENAPLYRVATDNVEIAAMFAPKPQGQAGDTSDWTKDYMTRGFPQMQAIYNLYGAKDAVFAQIYVGPHNYNVNSRQMSYDFFNTEFNLGMKEPVIEPPLKLIPPKQLSVYDDSHPMPTDFTDATGVRSYMTQTSDAQLAELAKKPKEYADTVKIAWQAMVVDQMPAAGDVEIVKGGAINPAEESHVWNGIIQRKGSGELVASRMLFPRNWNGTMVVWADPQGTDSLGDANPAAQILLDGGAAIAAENAYMSGDFIPAAPVPAVRGRQNYLGYNLGYNRSIFANRVHDLMSLIALAHGVSGVKSVQLVAFGGAGPWALATRALAGGDVDRAAIDLNKFDFDMVQQPSDPMLIPGALKYGGVCGLLPLCASPTLLCNARENARFKAVAPRQGVTLTAEARSPQQMAGWLLQE